MPIWRKGTMLVGREQEVDVSITLLRDGMSIDIVGPRGSGRSSILDALGQRLEALGFVVVRIRGIAALRQNPLTAISVAGFLQAPARTASAVAEAVTALSAAVGDRPAVIVVDDWDDLDDGSWGVIDAVRGSTGVPVVISRLRGNRARHTPSGQQAASWEPAYVIELPPLGYENLERIVALRLGGQPDTRTVSEIFIRSGGIVGLALNIVDVGVREGRITRGADGLWSATADLWSPGLRGIIESQLEQLDGRSRDAVDTLALLGPVDVETARTLVPWDVIETLEEQGLVTVVSAGLHQRVAVTPPLIVDFVRHAGRPGRSIRLTENIVSAVGVDDPLSLIAVTNGTSAPSGRANNAVFTTMLQERIRAQRIITRNEWERRREPATAIAYLRCLLQSAAPRETIEEVFAQTKPADSGTGSSTALTVMRAKWLGYVRDDLEAALQILHADEPRTADEQVIVTAAEVLIRASKGSVPDALLRELEESDARDDEAALASLEAQMYVAVVRGHFGRAMDLFDKLDARDIPHRRHIPRALRAWALTGLGRVAESLSVTRIGLEDAYARLDLDAMRAYGSAAVLTHLFIGDYEGAASDLDLLLAMGSTHSLPQGYDVSLLNAAAIVAYRRGDTALGERYVSELVRLDLPDGALPGQALSWAVAEQAMIGGDATRAALLLTSSADLLWARGWHYAAALGYVSALEKDPSHDLWVRVGPLLEEVEGLFVQAAGDYVRALVESDPEGLLDAARQLRNTGRVGYAVDAYRRAEELFSAGDQSAEAHAAATEREHLLSTGRGQLYDAARYSAAALTLSPRERGVARMAADGLANADIAKLLVLSTRTVESHMHRVLRKLGFDNRGQLAAVRAFLSER